MLHELECTVEHLQKCLLISDSIEITPPRHWRSDPWHLNQEEASLHSNEGTKIVQPGTAKETIIGGSLMVLTLFSGTEYLKPPDDLFGLSKIVMNLKVTWKPFL